MLWSQPHAIGQRTKADSFSPKLEHWIFATSASKAKKLQQAARELSPARKAQGLFTVTILGWEDVQFLLAQRLDVVADFYPERLDDGDTLRRKIRPYVSPVLS